MLCYEVSSPKAKRVEAVTATFPAEWPSSAIQWLDVTRDVNRPKRQNSRPTIARAMPYNSNELDRADDTMRARP